MNVRHGFKHVARQVVVETNRVKRVLESRTAAHDKWGKNVEELPVKVRSAPRPALKIILFSNWTRLWDSLTGISMSFREALTGSSDPSQ